MKNKNYIFHSLLFCCVFIFSCGGKEEKSEEKNNDPVEESEQELTFVELDAAQVNNLNEIMSQETIEFGSEKGGAGKKDKMWRVWKKLFRSCMSGDMIEKNPVYFGPTNAQTQIGHILKYDSEKEKFVSITPLLLSKLTKSEKELLCGEGFCNGSPGNCVESYTIKTDGSFLVNMGFTAKLTEANLQSAISTSRNVESTVDGFEHIQLNVGSLSDIMSLQDSDFKKNYFRWASKPGYILVNSMIKAKGFKSTITTSSDISGDLEARLKAPEGIVQKIANSDIEAKYSYISKRQISLTVNSSFIVFGGIISSKEFFEIEN